MVELGVPTGVVTAEVAIEIDGAAQPRLNSGLLSLVVEETTEGLCRCEARFGNWGSQGSDMDYLYFDRALLDFGSEIAVIAGSGDAEGEIFRGVISALEGQYFSGDTPQIAVLAEDAAQRLRVVRRTRVFEEMSDADVFGQIAREHGLQPDIDVQGPTHKVIAQLNQSDLAFVRERARRLAAEVWVERGRLLVQGRPQRLQQNEAGLALRFNRGLLEFSVTADTANQYTGVRVSGWDVSAKDTVEYEADDGALGSELNGDESGASIVRSAFSERVDRVVQQVPLTSEEAQSVAEAAFRAQARRFVVGAGLARGDARIRVGRAVELQGLGPIFTGTYAITETRHIFSRQSGGGYSTEFVAERAGIARA